MKAHITKKDVFLYFANQLDRARRRELESACQSDPQVQRWFEELTPRDDELDNEPICQVRSDTPEYRRTAAVSYQSVERTEQLAAIGQVSRIFGSKGQKPVVDRILTMPSKTPLFGEHGQMAYRSDIQIALAADNGARLLEPVEIPCIRLDDGHRRLIVRQWKDAVPSGIVLVSVARLGEDRQAEILAARQVELYPDESPDGLPCWYQEVPLTSLAPNLASDDDVVFYVEPVSEGRGAEKE